MLFTKDQHMIQALAAKRPDQAFNIWVFGPGDRGAIGRSLIPDPSHPVRESLSVSTIIVADQIARRRIPRKCLGDSLCQPLRRGMLGYREPEKLSATVAHDQKGKQALERQGRNQAKIDSRDRVGMVARGMSATSAMGGLSMFDHVFQETVDSGCDPSKPSLSSSPWMRGAPHNGFCFAHLPDEIA